MTGLVLVLLRCGQQSAAASEGAVAAQEQKRFPQRASANVKSSCSKCRNSRQRERLGQVGGWVRLGQVGSAESFSETHMEFSARPSADRAPGCREYECNRVRRRCLML